jgi:hypothetical protein
MDTPTTKPMSVLFFRVFWTLIGPFGLMFVAASIVQSGSGWFTGADLLFGLMLLATILCRWGDFWQGEQTDSYGKPVVAKDIQRYTLIAILAGGAIWVFANVLGNHLLRLL